ncbi:hypothetical protein IXO97_020735 [Xanthomonas oryzae pv. oryzae]|nr:hypothetical protein IXO97_020735 [Xanthomonas oryzae pv. oryzae]
MAALKRKAARHRVTALRGRCRATARHTPSIDNCNQRVGRDSLKKIAKSELTCCQHRNFNQSLPTLYILNLVKRVIRVSVETVKIVGGLPLIQ